MAEEILISVITASATVLTVGLTYILTKKKEIDASIRQKKADMYDELVRSLTEANGAHWRSAKPVNEFILAYYKASAYASDDVIQACSRLLTSIENKELDANLLTNLISNIYNAVRKDINKKVPTFNFSLMYMNPHSEKPSHMMR